MSPLQGKAFAAPGGALAEVRQLREELFAARRERALGEGREAELRRELAAIKRQVQRGQGAWMVGRQVQGGQGAWQGVGY